MPDNKQDKPHQGSKLSVMHTDIADILDQTQGHLILRMGAWRMPVLIPEIGLPVLYCLIALIFLIYFAIESFLLNQTWYAQILLIFAILTVCCFVYLRITGNRRATNTFIVLLLGLLCLFLFYTGGVNATGPMWYFVFPLVALFIQRLWEGILSVTTLVAITLFILFKQPAGFDPSIYTPVFLERFLAIYLAISVMAFLYAYLRTCAELSMDNVNRDFRNMANTDELTKLANRRRMREVLYQEVSRTRRNQGKFSLINLDIDHFKEINDRYGHDCGDTVLRAIPNILRKVLRTQDISARWGGEEFLILLPETGLDGARHVAERLRTAFAEYPISYEGREFSITASFGVSEFTHTDKLDDCIRQSDKNLYQAKTEGRNRVVAS